MNYCVTRRELLAIVHGVRLFKSYLLGRQFLIRTDHSSLKYLHRFKEPEGQLARWLDSLMAYRFEIEHRPGIKHGNADGLSRRPDPCGGKKCYCQTFNDLEYDPPVLIETHEQVEVAVQASPQCSSCGVMLNCDSCRVAVSTPEAQPKESQHVQTKPVEQNRAVTLTPLWSQEELLLAQEQDADVGPVLKLVKEGGERPLWTTISHLSGDAKIILKFWDSLSIRDGLLYRKVERLDPPVHWFQLILPREFRDVAVHNAHDTATAGHNAAARAYARVRARFWWPRLSDFIQRWVASCCACQRRKSPQKKAKAPLQSYVVGSTGERIATDLMGPFSQTDSGNQYIMVVQDYFSKYAVAIAIPDMAATTIATALLERWIAYMGVPLELHSDRGTQFEGDVMQNLCKLLDITKTRTTALRPQADGMVERLNRTLCDMLNCVGMDHPFNWDALLPSVVMAYNSSVQELTKQTPNAMVFGHELRLPLALLAPDNGQIKPFVASSAPDYVLQLQKHLEQVHILARDKLKNAALKQQTGYNNRLMYREYSPGDLVYYYYPVKYKKTSKEAYFRWQGPYVVVKRLSETVYLIQMNARSKALVVNHDKLKPARTRETIDTSWVHALKQDELSQEVSAEEAESLRPKAPRRQIKPPQRYGNWWYL